MKSLYLNDSGDLEFDNLHDLKVVDGLEEIKQRIRISLKTNQGEWFLNLRLGVPWIKLFSENAPAEEFKKEILKVLNNDPAIDEVEKIDLNFERQNRNLEIEFIAIANEERFRERVVI